MPRMLGLGGSKWVLADAPGQRRKMLIRHERSREARQFARSLAPEGLLPDPLDDPTACVHGCNGECLDDGSDSCSFACHPDGPVTEEQYWRARAALAREL